MRKYLPVLALLVLCSFTLTGAANVTIVVPAAAVAEATAWCDILRAEINARTWSIEECAGEFLRRGIRQFKASQERQALRSSIDGTVRASVELFDSDFPLAVEVMRCGDGIEDNVPGVYVEECDDGNLENADGCSSTCTNE